MLGKFSLNDHNATYNGHSGSRYLASFGAVSGASDDWAISPEVKGGKLSFHARSYYDTYGLESLEVLASAKGTDKADFTLVKAYPELPVAWTEYSVSAVYDYGESPVSRAVTPGLSGLDSLEGADATISAADGVLTVTTPAAMAVSVHSADGRTEYAGSVSGRLSLPLASGVYVVRAGERSAKVML